MIWRVGRHQPRNIYFGDEFVAVAVGENELAADVAVIICDALNKAEVEMRKEHGIAWPPPSTLPVTRRRPADSSPEGVPPDSLSA